MWYCLSTHGKSASSGNRHVQEHHHPWQEHCLRMHPLPSIHRGVVHSLCSNATIGLFVVFHSHCQPSCWACCLFALLESECVSFDGFCGCQIKLIVCVGCPTNLPLWSSSNLGQTINFMGTEVILLLLPGHDLRASPPSHHHFQHWSGTKMWSHHNGPFSTRHTVSFKKNC